MSEKRVRITRKWSDPMIAVDVVIGVGDERIEIVMPLDQFISELVATAGNPALLLTVAGLRARLASAAEEVCRKMKHETKRVM